jgi:hypothetical protein
MAQAKLTREQWDETKAAIEKHGGDMTAAAVELGRSPRALSNRRATARAEGWELPDGFLVKGTSTLYGPAGEQMLQWVKTGEDPRRQEEILLATVKALVKDIAPCKPLKAPKGTNADLCVAYCIGDAHLGLYAWGAETGADFDIEIAKRGLMGAADRLVHAAPAADEALIVQLGDFYHIDDYKNATPASGNRLDVDSRFPKVIRVGINTMRHLIDRALEKHKLVRVRNVAGNHDPTASITLTEAIRGYYIKEPRVIVEDSPRSFFVYRFGANLVGITHGHTGKPEDYAGVLAVDGSQHWGECAYKYVWHGHIHQKRVFEKMGVLTESFRTLAAQDAWATEQGYRAGREMQAIVLHKQFGEIERHTAGIRMVQHEARP